MTTLAPPAVLETMRCAAAITPLDKSYKECISSALKAAQEMGWVLVPVEPTDNMLTRGLYEQWGPVQTLTIGELRKIYAAMLAARGE